MSDAPEKILVGLANDSLLIDCKGQRLASIDTHVEYIRADLALSPNICEALEALLDKLLDIRGIEFEVYASQEITNARAALAQHKRRNHL
jgi:hypothetical protein